MEIIFTFVVALAAPIVLLPIEKLWPYPFVIEEVAKLFLVVGLLRWTYRFPERHWGWVVFGAGALFAFSESMLYISHFFISGNFEQWPLRPIVTSLLHGGTTTLLYIAGFMNRWLLVCALPLAIAIHFFFNQIITLNTH